MDAQAMSVSASLEETLTELIQTEGCLEPSEIVVHFDLVATTRRFEGGRERIERRHWATVGADPHTSYGALNAQAVKILRQDLT